MEIAKAEAVVSDHHSLNMRPSGRLVDDLLKYTPYIACGVAVIAAGAAIMLKIKAKKQ
jgi:hypothetical protein